MEAQANRILLAVCTIVAVPSGADDAASGIVDSQTFLKKNSTPRVACQRFRRSRRETSGPDDAERKNWPDDAAGDWHGH